MFDSSFANCHGEADLSLSLIVIYIGLFTMYTPRKENFYIKSMLF